MRPAGKSVRVQVRAKRKREKREVLRNADKDSGRCLAPYASDRTGRVWRPAHLAPLFEEKIRFKSRRREVVACARVTRLTLSLAGFDEGSHYTSNS